MTVLGHDGAWRELNECEARALAGHDAGPDGFAPHVERGDGFEIDEAIDARHMGSVTAPSRGRRPDRRLVERPV